jgi:DNA-binding MarR family transcriptional regulator/GNAT superfamily N-acetyltransferase
LVEVGIAVDGDERAERVAAVRAFNRFYTGVIGALDAEHLRTPYSLTEARVVWELAQRGSVELRELRDLLGLDAGYLTRIINRFAADGLVDRERSESDARRQVVTLAEPGRAVWRQLDGLSTESIGALLDKLGDEDQRRLVAAMGVVRGLLDGAPRPPSYLLRPPRPGDLGWVISRNGALYAEEYGWDASYEALVARIVAEYVDGQDPARECAWIAEVDGEPVGCVFVVADDVVADDREEGDGGTARLRLLLVEPSVRGMGIGGRLVEECLRFARRAGYRRMVLWTNDVLTAARRIYQRAGFELIGSDKHHSFGHDLVGETWARDL